MYHFSLLGSETLKLCFHRRSNEKKKKKEELGFLTRRLINEILIIILYLSPSFYNSKVSLMKDQEVWEATNF